MESNENDSLAMPMEVSNTVCSDCKNDLTKNILQSPPKVWNQSEEIGISTKQPHSTKKRSREGKSNHEDLSTSRDNNTVDAPQIYQPSLITPPEGNSDSINAIFGTYTPSSPDLKKTRSSSISSSSNDDDPTEHPIVHSRNSSSELPCLQMKSSDLEDGNNTQDCNDEDSKPSAFLKPRLPIAPCLELYFREGGTKQYMPRPEWCRTPEFVSYQNQENINMVEEGTAGLISSYRDDFIYRNILHGLEPNDVAHQHPPLLNQYAPDNGLLSDQTWGDNINNIGQISSSFGVAPGDITFPNYPPTNIWQETFSSSNEEESNNLNMSSFDEDSSAVLSKAASREGDLFFASPMDDLTVRGALFGRDQNTALFVCIQHDATEAALEIIRFGSPINIQNAKGVTPLILASQKGNLTVCETLLKKGANPGACSMTGATALIQACHFGQYAVAVCLLGYGAMVDQSNKKNTTALMRAAQEGHLRIVRLLLSQHDCKVNRENYDRMTALMLAAQRGHADITQALIRAGARIDVKTAQDSTSLMLAVKRGNLEVVKVLIAAGSELMLRDSRGRTAKDICTRKGLMHLANLMTHEMQISLMKHSVMLERTHVILLLSTLLQQGRASVKIYSRGNQVMEHNGRIMSSMSKSKRALVQTMMLPTPLVGLISSYLPPPRLWEKRLEMLTRRCYVDADSTIASALDLIDEVLDEEGFTEACDKSGITPPANFETWAQWKKWGYSEIFDSSSCDLSCQVTCQDQTQKEKTQKLNTFIKREYKVLKLRRNACFLQLLTHRSPLLAKSLLSSPYEIPEVLIQKLKNTSDIQSLVRRLGSYGVHFEVSIAMEVVMLASQLILWHHSSAATNRNSSDFLTIHDVPSSIHTTNA